MRKLFYAVLVGLVGAGIIHILVLMMVPDLSERDAWSRLAMASGLYRMSALEAETGGQPVVKSVDPLFLAAACRFDLADGMVQVKAPGTVPFWSMSIYNRNGHNIYSLNDHSATNGRLDLVALTPAQMLEIRRQMPEDLDTAILVETPITQGILVVRAFVPDESWRPAVTRFLEQSSCLLKVL
ncbi:DUF1254 domain-containing protein [Aquamicrobium segne]|uniref:DUF1254 domain-containing protein n=1 Tax=Aquamicrobium segne TaxID=469547 RepID=A0ABW0GW73_9HYPH